MPVKILLTRDYQRMQGHQSRSPRRRRFVKSLEKGFELSGLLNRRLRTTRQSQIGDESEGKNMLSYE